MKFTDTNIHGVKAIKLNAHSDKRGIFVKTFHSGLFAEHGIKTSFKESFYSVSAKDVIRGMHFHLPPHAHDKLVYVVSGKITDVVLDLRKKSPTYGRYISEEMSSENRKAIYIPAGCAHGFLSLEDNSIVMYEQSSLYDHKADAGILWNSFGMNWGVTSPIISERDGSFTAFGSFDSPF